VVAAGSSGRCSSDEQGDDPRGDSRLDQRQAGDATQAHAESYAPLEPTVDGRLPAEFLLVDRVNFRALGPNYKGSLTNDSFVNLLDLGTTWKPAADGETYEAHGDLTGVAKWMGSRTDPWSKS
jgi:catalase-peroxidase